MTWHGIKPRKRSLLLRIYEHVSPRRRYQGMLVVGLTFFSSIAEVVSLGAVVPFIGILTEPERLFRNRLVLDVARAAGIASAADLILPFCIMFATAALVAGALRLLLLWTTVRLANAVGGDLSIEIHRRTLYQPYRVHVERSSSEIISGITVKVATATSVLISLVTAITSTVLFVAILGTLLVIDASVATIAIVTFGAGYAVAAQLTRRRLRRNGEAIATGQTGVVKALQEGLGSIRDVLLDGTQVVYSNAYARAIRRLQTASGENTFINQAPRFAMEIIGMVMVALLAYALSLQSHGTAGGLTTLGALAFGAQRMLPLLQILYGNWTVVVGNKASLADVLDLLDQPMPKVVDQTSVQPMRFDGAIQLRDVCFSYAEAGPKVLDGVTLTIAKGARVGLVGSTGSGKSTVLDIIMGLIPPTDGQFLVDGRPMSEDSLQSWQRTIAHVPQSIYLTDATIAENIAFGVPRDEIDMGRVWDAVLRAQLTSFIEERPDGLSGMVGERGVRLSGGQRQRIGLARALYKRASVLILDEATSALDSASETAVMSAIENLDRDLTIIIVAHRLTTLRYCDSIMRIENGRVDSICSYAELINSERSRQNTGAQSSLAVHHLMSITSSGPVPDV